MRKTRLPPLGALRAFHAVAGCRSFKLAAEALGVSATAVSHQIKLLESVLECRVCERSAQGVSLTEIGEILYAGTQRAFAALEQSVAQITRARQPPALTVTTTSNFLTHWLVPRGGFQGGISRHRSAPAYQRRAGRSQPAHRGRRHPLPRNAGKRSALHPAA